MEYIRKAVQAGRTYDELAPRIKSSLSAAEWKAKVKQVCIEAGMRWDDSASLRSVCSEQEYYDELVRCYKHWGRLYPHHMADYVARFMRHTAFKYYVDVLSLTLKEERSYDTIPNFTAADALRYTGVGRNEYIAIMERCKARRLVWRVTKGVARELLPAAPLDVRAAPWWHVCVVQVGEAEFRDLAPTEVDALKRACDPRSPAPASVADFPPPLLQLLHRKGLIYFDVPVGLDDRFAIPPLEGFVSNKTSQLGDVSVDPREALLYKVFVANSERMSVAELAEVLGVEVSQVALSLGVAVRLGFATRVSGSEDAAGRAALGGGALRSDLSSLLPSRATSGALVAPPPAAPAAAAAPAPTPAPALPAAALGAGAGTPNGEVFGVVVDVESTSYLMMGALSPGLFEGGRVSGHDVIAEMITELWASYKGGQEFEGDMRKLTDYAAALASLLEAVRGSGAGRSVELLRKESLAGLDSEAARKVLSHAYAAIVPIAPLPPPVLPLSPLLPGPASYGPTSHAASPWMQLALYGAARKGPVSLVFVAGQRVWRLPSQLQGCTHALLWCWDGDGRAGQDGQPQLVEGTYLLYTLNELLSRTAVLAQPLVYVSAALGASHGAEVMHVVDVPLPFEAGPESSPEASVDADGDGDAEGDEDDDSSEYETDSGAEEASQASCRWLPVEDGGDPAAGPLPEGWVLGVDQSTGTPRRLALPSGVLAALRQLGLSRAVGVLRLMRMHGGDDDADGEANVIAGAAASGQTGWLPLTAHQGVPLYDFELCRRVCAAASAAEFLSPAAREAHRKAQCRLQLQLLQLVAAHSAMGPPARCTAEALAAVADGSAPEDLPLSNLLFDGSLLQTVDLSDCCQGAGGWVTDP